MLDLATILIIITSSQVLFLLFSLSTIESKNNRARIFLVLVLLFVLWYQLEFLAIRSAWDVSFNLLFGMRYGSWLALGPLLYFYTLASLSSDFRFRRKDGLHFLPFVVLTLLIPLGVEGLVTNRAVHYGMLTVFDSWNREPITTFQYVYGVIALGQFFVVFGYSLWSLHVISRTEQALKDEYSNLQIASLRWQKVVHRATSIAVLLVAGYVVYQFYTTEYRRPTDYLFVVPLSVAVYLLSFQTLRYPQLFFIDRLGGSHTSHNGRYKKSSLSPGDREAYLQQLKDALEKDKLYLNRELRLGDVADHLSISPHHLSQVINEGFQQNFFDLINTYRVDSAKQRIAASDKESLLQIAFEVGFNNKTSFNNAFKRHVGMTPSQFRKTL